MTIKVSEELGEISKKLESLSKELELKDRPWEKCLFGDKIGQSEMVVARFLDNTTLELKAKKGSLLSEALVRSFENAKVMTDWKFSASLRYYPVLHVPFALLIDIEIVGAFTSGYRSSRSMDDDEITFTITFDYARAKMS